MKKLLMFSILIIFLILSCFTSNIDSNRKITAKENEQIANPAACYFHQMGYTITKKQDSMGHVEFEYKLPNGVIVDPWAFFRGEIYPEYSYFAQYGYVSVIDTITDKYGQKIPKYYIAELDSSNNIIEKTTIYELMQRNGDTLCNGKMFFQR